MSYDVALLDKQGKAVEVTSHKEGGVIVLGGSKVASMSITYNYAFFYYSFLDSEEGIRWLYGKQAKDTVNRLERAVKILGTHRYDDYWAPTPGNAGHVLNVLLEWAREYPEAVWDGD